MAEILRFHSEPYVVALERAETRQMVGTDDRNAFAIGTMENPLVSWLVESGAHGGRRIDPCGKDCLERANGIPSIRRYPSRTP